MVRLLKKEGIHLEYVDLGGGFGIPYEGDGMDLGALAGCSHAPPSRDRALKLILEPGRSLVGEAGLLVTRVAALKKSGGKTFVITDAGMTELLRPSHYGGLPRRSARAAPGTAGRRSGGRRRARLRDGGLPGPGPGDASAPGRGDLLAWRTWEPTVSPWRPTTMDAAGRQRSSWMVRR